MNDAALGMLVGLGKRRIYERGDGGVRVVEWPGLPLGTMAPDFHLPNEYGKHVDLKGLLGTKPILLAFYPSDFGVMCAVEMMALRDHYPELKELCHLLGISTNTTYSHGAWSESLRLPFQLLSDIDGEVSKRYNVWPVDETGYFEGRSLRAVFIIDLMGSIIYCWATDNPGLEPDYNEILLVLRNLKGSV